MIYIVQLTDGTIGTIDSSCLGNFTAGDFIGDCMTIKTHDENGNPIEITGILESVK